MALRQVLSGWEEGILEKKQVRGSHHYALLLESQVYIKWVALFVTLVTLISECVCVLTAVFVCMCVCMCALRNKPGEKILAWRINFCQAGRQKKKEDLSISWRLRWLTSDIQIRDWTEGFLGKVLERLLSPGLPGACN